jgi:hypothetical protein
VGGSQKPPLKDGIENPETPQKADKSVIVVLEVVYRVLVSSNCFCVVVSKERSEK